MISEAIKEKENFIITKNSIEITTDSRIVAALNSSSLLSSKYNFTNVYIAQKGRSHLLLRNQEEEKSMKGLQLFQYNWNNKINMIQDEIFYTSSRLVGTSGEDSGVLPFVAAKFLNTLLNPHFMFAPYKKSLLIRASRDSCSFSIELPIFNILFQLDWNNILMNIVKENKRKYLAAESGNEYLKVEIENMFIRTWE